MSSFLVFNRVSSLQTGDTVSHVGIFDRLYKLLPLYESAAWTCLMYPDLDPRSRIPTWPLKQKIINVVQFFLLDKLMSNAPKVLVFVINRAFCTCSIPNLSSLFIIIFTQKLPSRICIAIPTEKFLHLTSRELGLLRRDGRGLFLYLVVQPEHTTDLFISRKAED